MLSRRLVESIVHQLSAAFHDLGGNLSFVVEDLAQQITDATSIASVSEPTFVVMVEARLAGALDRDRAAHPLGHDRPDCRPDRRPRGGQRRRPGRLRNRCRARRGTGHDPRRGRLARPARRRRPVARARQRDQARRARPQTASRCLPRTSGSPVPNPAPTVFAVRSKWSRTRRTNNGQRRQPARSPHAPRRFDRRGGRTRARDVRPRRGRARRCVGHRPKARTRLRTCPPAGSPPRFATSTASPAPTCS